ncbi:MAG: MBL fold metallo-hydrolase [Gammaproteobacteria bacterium]|nr:MBL fold metallo-hydrolase [Gammaproteobacteria bacterium]
MILRQFIDYPSYTYTYLVADEASGSACLIDPVLENCEAYEKRLSELGLTLVLAIDTHVHADHITGLGKLREMTGCASMAGLEAGVSCATDTFSDGDRLTIGALSLLCLHTPGHTGESYCFYLENAVQPCFFTGDTLLIRGSGRTDFQNGSAEALYHSLRRLLQYSDQTIVYPGHDYNGNTSSTIGEERAHNPRIGIEDMDAFIEHMGNLNLPDPKMMDVAVAANQACGELQPPVGEH